MSKSEDDVLQCECGCITFTIARDGLIECSNCRGPTEKHLAVQTSKIAAKVKAIRRHVIREVRN